MKKRKSNFQEIPYGVEKPEMFTAFLCYSLSNELPQAWVGDLNIRNCFSYDCGDFQRETMDQ